MFLTNLERIETEFFRGLNRVVEPLVRAGALGPVMFPATPIVIEIKGRKTGRRTNLPLLAARMGDLIIVSTIRRRSSWVKNLAAHPEVRYWMGGIEREATAFAIASGIDTPEDLPAQIICLANALRQHSKMFGTGFAILAPRKVVSGQ